MKSTLLLLALATIPLWAQTAATPSGQKLSKPGVPFLTWYGPETYNGATQIWSIAEDTRGVIYVGHQGVLEYDGTTFRNIPTPHNSSARSLVLGPQGRIYVGETGDFGYLQPDSNGKMHYQSLVPFVPKEEHEFQNIADIHIAAEGIYFRARERLFLLTPEGKGWRSRSWKPRLSFGRSYYINGILYLNETLSGLNRMDKDQLVPVSFAGLDWKKAEDRPAVLLSWNRDSKEMLLATNDARLFIVAGEQMRALPNQAQGLIGLNNISAGSILPDGSIGIGIRRGGFLILERDGSIRHLLGRAEGIPSDGVLCIYSDRRGNVWLGLQNGIARIEMSSPLSEYSAASGMSASVNHIQRQDGILYVGTMAGLRRLTAKATFDVVEGSQTHSVFGMLSRPGGLLAAASNNGLYEITAGKYREIIPRQTGVNHMALVPSLTDPKRIWVGNLNSLSAIREEAPGRWVLEETLTDAPEIRSLLEAKPGEIWLGTQSRGVLRVRLNGNSLKNPKVDRYLQGSGLPSDGGVSVHRAGDHILFAAIEGVREFDPVKERFVESKIFGAVPTGGSSEEYTVVANRNGDLWVNFGVHPVFFAKQPDGSYKADYDRIRRIPAGRISWMFMDDDDILWLGGQDRLYRFDPSREQRNKVPFPALIRRVISGEQQKSTLYNGGGGEALQQPAGIAYRDNAVRFEFAAAHFVEPAKNQFRTMLDGFDSDWSAWSTESRRDYTNLPPGQYTFRVKARSSLMEESAQDGEYRFEILPPWYRTWAAYAVYVLLLVAAAFAADRLMRRRLIAKERAASEARMIQSELERKRNVELLSEIGKELTASLDIDTIFHKLYENVNQLMDASVFGVGLYHPEENSIEYRLAYENGKRYEPYRRDAQDKNQFPVWCIDNRKPVFINDVAAEYSRYIPMYEDKGRQLEDGTASQPPQSLIYLPLVAKERVLGIITVQSFRKGAYSDYQLNLLENLAAYTSIALDNADAYDSLKSAQEKLVVQEKLASLGALTAGIAHEIKNPLNFVNNFADLSGELMTELREELEKYKDRIPADEFENLEGLIRDLSGNAKKINEHGRRADGIVKSMLLHSRGQAGERQATDLNAMLEEYVNLAYHGMRAQDSSFNVTIVRELAPDIGKIDAVPQDLSRVFLNILNNACYAANDKAKKAAPGFAPTLTVRTVNLGEWVEVRIRDNGQGIPQEIRDRIFHPFFTTKPTGQGTGLGLSISHDIVVIEHGGQLEVETEAGEFTEFIVRLPRQGRKAA
ncbi:MAG: GAF domain-containing protein [Acidobacteria bacterium]|nr:GAF domain-containing protein [Acidobacteriota bacterium]